MRFLKKMNFLQSLNIKTDKALLGVFLVFGVILLLKFFLSSGKGESIPNETSKESFAVDTMIPAGYLLIPLELSNSESLASLSGQFSIVDLYASGEKGRRGFKVAAGVKLLRAPLNPQQFAVLIKEEDSTKIVGREGPFFAALKNPQQAAKSSAEKTIRHPLIIQYGE
ncbi:MAG: hypothetical protein ACXVB1_10185 [Pseudobdellovibrionaceae bacterium]